MSDGAPLAAGEELALGAEGDQVAELQRRLEHLEHYQGKIDGRYGEMTAGAVSRFQSAAGQLESGTVDADTWSLLADYSQETEASQLSEDGQWQWNGTEWVAAAEPLSAEPGLLSDDGQWQWNGTDWVAAGDLAIAAMHQQRQPTPGPQPATSSTTLPLDIVEKPHLEDGEIVWSVKNVGQVTLHKGAPISEWEVWDADDLTKTLIPRKNVDATAPIRPGGVERIRVPVPMWSPRSTKQRFKVIVQSGQTLDDFEYDWADPRATPAPPPPSGPLLFEKKPHVLGGALRWSVRNASTSAMRAGTPIGEWEIWDGDNIVQTLVSPRVVKATADIPPGGVVAVDPIALAPVSPGGGLHKAIVTLGGDLAEVDYTMRNRKVVP